MAPRPGTTGRGVAIPGLNGRPQAADPWPVNRFPESARRVRSVLPLAVVAAASLALAYRWGSPGDYVEDAGPAIDALRRGDLHRFFAEQPLMGSFSLLLRAPLAALAHALGAGEPGAYRLGAAVCVLAGGLLGLELARTLRRRGAPAPAQLTVAALCLANPASAHALQYGHPEEILAGALCVGAVLAAGRDRPLAAGALLGLALSTKQWAVLAVLPAALAAPGRRVRLVALAAAVAVASTLPLYLGDPQAFAHQASLASNTSGLPRVSPTNVWWPLAHERVVRVLDGVAARAVPVRELPERVNDLTHPLIVLLGLVLPALLALRRRRAGGRAPLDAAPTLLALLLLLRCALDPVDIGYYHAPLLLALLALDAGFGRGLPLLGMLAATGWWAIFQHLLRPERAAPACAAYLAAAAALAAYLALRAYSPTAISDLGKRLRISGPSSVTTTRSSILTPNSPGR